MAFTSMTAHISITKVSKLYDLVFFSKKTIAGSRNN